MRKLAVVTALVSSSVACGGFLGFGDDDDPVETPSTDGGPETSVADATGSTNPDASLVCESLVEDFAVFTDNAQLPGAQWRRYFGQTNCGLLGFDGGAFVAEIPATSDGGPCTSTNAGIFRRFDAGVQTLECEMDVTVDTFSGRGAFLEYRVEQGTSYTQYRANGGWNVTGMLGRASSNDPGGAVTDDPKSAPGVPDGGVSFRVRARLDVTATPTFTFHHRPDSQPPLVSTLPEAGAAEFWELYVGVTDTDSPRVITIDNVTCEACR